LQFHAAIILARRDRTLRPLLRISLPQTPSLPRCIAAAAIALMAAAAAQEPTRRNWFDDPFDQATFGLPSCPQPTGPLLTEAEMRREAHQRIERGTTCWLAKQCAEPNAYAGDARINEAAVRALAAEPRLQATQLWVITQRRFVFVQGCVGSAQQRRVAVDTLKRLPDADYVSDEMMIGTGGKPPYAVAAPRN
jgi:hypothetical protein